MDNIDKIQLFIQSLDGSANQLKEKLYPVLSQSLEEIAASEETPIESIKVYNTYLYILVSSIFAYLKTIGVNTDTHPIVKELERVKTYMKRVKQLENDLNNKDNTREANEAAKKFLHQTLGTKINGGGAAVPAGMESPAISASNFEGKHTKFDDSEGDDNKSDGTRILGQTVNSGLSKSKSLASKPSKSKKVLKVLKPSTSSKSNSGKGKKKQK